MNEKQLLDSKGKPFHYLTDDIKKIIEAIEAHPKCSTGVFLIILSTIRYIFWAITYGKADYWGIGVEWINTDTNNMVYELLMLLLYGIIFIAVNCIPCLIAMRNKEHKCKGVLLIFLSVILIFFGLIIFVLLLSEINIFSVIKYLKWTDFKNVVLLSAIITVGSLSGGLYTSYEILFNNTKKTLAKKAKKNKTVKDLTPKVFVLFIIIFLAETLAFKHLGRNMADTQKVFTTVENYAVSDDIIPHKPITDKTDDKTETLSKYVILGEKAGYYICSPSVIDEEKNSITIYKNEHLTISSKSIMTQTQKYTFVYPKKERQNNGK